MGDIPTPTKEKLGEAIVDQMMRDVYWDPGTTFSTKVVKYADLLESVHFIQNYGVGRLAYRVRVLLTLRLLDMIEQEEDSEVKKAVDSILHDLNQGDFEI